MSRTIAKKALLIDHGRYIPALLNSVANKLASGSSANYRHRFGVGVTEWRILSLLATEPDCTAQRICEFFDLDKALVSRTLQPMIQAQIIAVSEDSRRRTIRATPKGQALHDRIIKVALERERRLLSTFSASEVEALTDFLSRLVLQVRKLNTETALARQRTAELPKRPKGNSKGKKSPRLSGERGQRKTLRAAAKRRPAF